MSTLIGIDWAKEDFDKNQKPLFEELAMPEIGGLFMLGIFFVNTLSA